MARITTTDCERIVPNRFELVVLAAARARELLRGDEPRVPTDGDRPPVIALREIAAQKLDLLELRSGSCGVGSTSVRIGPSCNVRKQPHGGATDGKCHKIDGGLQPQEIRARY
jgi:DNA-directed RNA polymerase omega subunit